MKRISQRIILLLAAFFALAGEVFSQQPTAAQAYAAAANVVIVKYMSVDERGGRQVMTVEKTYKGNMKPGDEVCFQLKRPEGLLMHLFPLWPGARFLYYLPAAPANGIWSQDSVIRSGFFNWDPPIDMLFLDKLKSALGKTRIAGQVTKKVYRGTATFRFAFFEPLPRQAIVISGAGKTVRARTDKHGYYEAYGLPPGEYWVMPQGLPGYKLKGSETGGFAVQVERGGHVECDMGLTIDNAVTGIVVDEFGKPLEGIYVRLAPELAEFAGFEGLMSSTNADGVFEMRDIPPGTYVVVANQGRRLSFDVPFGELYYPSGSSRETAARIEIGPGDHPDRIVLQAPARAIFVTVGGILLEDSGEPARNAAVSFEEDVSGRDEEDRRWPANAGAMTDGDGRFEMKIVKGTEGTVSAARFVPLEDCVECDPPEKPPGPCQIFGVFASTEALPLLADEDRKDIELKMRPPSCRIFGMSIRSMSDC